MCINNKRLSAIILALLMCLLLAACGGAKGPKAGESAEKAVRNYLEAVKKKDLKTASQYLEGSDTLSESSEDYSEMPELADKLFGFDYKIISSDEQDGHAIVRVQVTTYDFGTFFGSLLKDAFAAAFPSMINGGEEADMDAIMNEAISNNMYLLKSKDITTEAEIELNKHENGWKIKNTTSIANAVFGGTLNSLADMFGGFGE